MKKKLLSKVADRVGHLTIRLSGDIIMRRISYASTIAIVVLMISAANVQASMRCENGIVSEGDTTFEVIKKCGKPISREKIDPIIGSDGRTPSKAMPIENWVYTSSGGMYRYLRFIDGKLAKIESRRF